ncbi:MAG: hypothetical protein HYT12_04645 [Candidatus Liptonbacteria bacterium]|nr:hypothetical protein [Candidatus Liptonbacteria bacterium]
MNIQERLARVSFFKVTPDLSVLKENERQALKHCVQAARITTDIYLDQVAHGNLEVLNALKKRSDQEGIDLLHYFNIHGTPWDAYDHDKPFVPGVGAKPEFGSFYPRDLTKEEWESWLSAHPEDREAFESNYTVIKRRKNGLVAVPYSEEYANQLTDAANHLHRAASHLPEGALRSFLKLRANAFLSNNYFESDMSWVDTDGNPFEVTIGPYEVYFDGLLGLKAAFEAFIALPDKDASSALRKFAPLVPDFDLMLTQEFNFSPKGAAIPLEVVADVIRGGEVGFGYMFVAYNLPNDRRVHDLKGSKKVFSRTMMEAKFYTEVLPVAERIFSAKDVELCTFDHLFKFVLGHELAHGLGPSKIKVGDKEMPFEVALKDLHSALEEAKADMLGIRLLHYFRNRGIFDEKTLVGIVVTEFAAHFRQWRHGFTEAHSKGELIEYNWLRAADALRYDTKRKQYDINPERCIDAMSRLSTEFLNLQVAGDYDRAKAFMEHWGKVPKELPSIIEGLADIPTAVSPIFELNI